MLWNAANDPANPCCAAVALFPVLPSTAFTHWFVAVSQPRKDSSPPPRSSSRAPHNGVPARPAEAIHVAQPYRVIRRCARRGKARLQGDPSSAVPSRMLAVVARPLPKPLVAFAIVGIGLTHVHLHRVRTPAHRHGVGDRHASRHRQRPAVHPHLSRAQGVASSPCSVRRSPSSCPYRFGWTRIKNRRARATLHQAQVPHQVRVEPINRPPPTPAPR